MTTGNETEAQDERVKLFQQLHSVLDEMADKGAVISYDVKVQFLDKSRVHLQHKNQAFAHVRKPSTSVLRKGR